MTVTSARDDASNGGRTHAAAEAVWFAVLVGSAVLLIGTLELAHDEAYYWICSLYPDWSYYDHPPLISWSIALTQGWIDGEWGVRLVPFAAFLAAAVLASRTLVPAERRWAWWAGLLIFPLLSIVLSFAMPDTVLAATGLVLIWSLHRYVERDTYGRALVIGAVAALVLYAKYHGALLILGAILGAPELLKRRSFWLAAAFGGLLFLPHLLWLWQHQASTLAYHLFQAHGTEFSLLGPLAFLLSQVALPGLLLAPWVWVVVWRSRTDGTFHRALVGMVLVTLAVFLLLSLTKRIEANWTLPASLAALVLVVRSRGEWPLHQSWFRFAGVSSVVLILAAKLFLVFPVAQPWVPRLGEIHGWKAWAQKLGEMTPECELVANRYQFAAKLSFYLDREILSLNINGRPNQFDVWGFEDRLRGKNLCWLTSETDLPATELFTPENHKVLLVRDVRLETLEAERNGD